MSAWQRGYDLDLLRSISQRFADHDGPLPLGAFSRARENIVAGWLSDGRLDPDPAAPALVVSRISRVRSQIPDFRRIPIAAAHPGTLIVDRVAGPADAIAAEIRRRAGDRPILWRRWASHPEERAASESLSLDRLGTAISASSEIRAIDARDIEQTARPDPADLVGIAPMDLPEIAPTDQDLADLALWPDLVSERWTEHYSSYNRRRSWHAVALRSFGGSEQFIEKPAEMSRRWREEHPDALGWQPADTALLDALPGARRILSRFACPLERVRLMRLTPGGELSRHADITDRAAGLDDGQIARLHLPIVTDPSVRFQTWDLDDEPTTVHMEPGRWWYLDVRKPHRAVNESAAERIHLVVDVVVTPEIRETLRP